MSDFKRHIEESLREVSADNVHTGIKDIEHDIANDIDALLKERTGRYYLSDKFKCNGHSIDIIYPGLQCPCGRRLAHQPDHIRFLLSLFPEKERLLNIDKIILLPRHIEINGMELVSLYLRSEKILVMYLHSPHLYTIESSDFEEYSFIPCFFYQYVSGDGMWSRCIDADKNINKIPPLWYILSVISFSPDNKVDKFFIYNKDFNGEIAEGLDTISLFYSRNGY